MKMKWEEFFARRAEDLAFIHLTRRDDLLVNRLDQPDSGVDFLVTVTRGGVPTGRMFGVQAKAREGSIRSTGELNELVSGAQGQSFLDVPFPLCIFAFTMGDDRGYYGWLKEPVLRGRRSPALQPVERVRWTELDRVAMANLVRTVETWYESRKRSTRQPSTRPEPHPQAV